MIIILFFFHSGVPKPSPLKPSPVVPKPIPAPPTP
ncbi:unnamed protein product, partial [Rotaria sordida]